MLEKHAVGERDMHGNQGEVSGMMEHKNDNLKYPVYHEMAEYLNITEVVSTKQLAGRKIFDYSPQNTKILLLFVWKMPNTQYLDQLSHIG